jgi:hypothetical protein
MSAAALPGFAHDAVCQAAVDAYRLVSKGAVTAAFIASLGSRDLVGRSALGSYAVTRHLSPHPFCASLEFPHHCRVCGGEAETWSDDTPDKLAMWRRNYPFQVRHTNLIYASYDLSAFAREPSRSPADTEVALFQDIVAAIRSLPETAGLTELSQCLIGKLKSNRGERQILLEQLGYCGILCPKEQESYNDHYVSFDTREGRQPSHHARREWEYPVRFWAGTDGIEQKALEDWFSPWL